MVDNYNSKLNKLSNSESYDDPVKTNNKFSLKKHILNVTLFRNFLKYQKNESLPFNIIMLRNNSNKQNNKRILKKPLKMGKSKDFNSSSQNLLNIIKEKNSRNKLNKNKITSQRNTSNYFYKGPKEKLLPEINKSHSLKTFDYSKSLDSIFFYNPIKNNIKTIKNIKRNYKQLLSSKVNILEETNKKIFKELIKERLKIKKNNEIIQSKYYLSIHELKKNNSQQNIKNIVSKESMNTENLVKFIKKNINNNYINDVNQFNHDLEILNIKKINIGKKTDLVSRMIIRNNF